MRQPVIQSFVFLAIMALLVLVPAGTYRYGAAWAFLMTFALGMTLVAIDVAKHDPALFARRQNVGPAAEPLPEQKTIQALNAVVIAAVLIIAGFDRRYGWSNVPHALVITGDILVLTGFAIMAIVFRTNNYAISTVEVQPGQRVVDRGPYAIVRHPMYAGSALMFSGMPMALASWPALAGVFGMMVGLVARILSEERLLMQHLAGYPDYCRRVRWRLLPGVW
jgi:protein-S-isoprenylcysteine O-methyltransferase Ste14